MRPLRKKDLIPETASDLNIEEGIVQQVVDFYWKELALNIREMRHLNITIPKLGTMRIVRSELENMKDRLLGYLKDQTEGSPTFNNMTFKLGRVEELIQMRSEEYKKREVTLEKREIYEQGKKNMGKQVEDSGGDLV